MENGHRETEQLLIIISLLEKFLQQGEFPKIIGCHQGKSSLVATPDISYESFSSLVSALCLAYLSDDLSHILYHHLICCYRLHCKQTPLVDVTPAETNPLLAELK